MPNGSKLCVRDTLISSAQHIIVDRGIADNCACSYCSHQQELDMIPLMMQEVRRLLPLALSGLACLSSAWCAQDFKPKGWLGLILVRAPALLLPACLC